MFEVLFLFGPIAATGLAVYMLYSGLEGDRGDQLLRYSLALLILPIVPFWLSYVSSAGGLASLFSFLIGIVCSLIAVIFGGWMLWKQKGRWKLIGLMIGVLFPVSLFTGGWLGETQSRENRTERNGDQIVFSLNQYYEDKGQFPKALSLLEPDYLVTQPEALTTQHTGWLYESEGDSFTLGYWHYPAKFGSIVCLYVSTNGSWDCEFNGWGPFKMVPTPGHN